MYKKILTLIAITLSTIITAQTSFVSTSPENKNVVLEDFTGIYCGNCPDGHLKAQDIYDANPSDVVLINIHTGSYANPNSGDPDFRTQFGSAIAGQTNLAGYPAGTVNRHEFPGLQQNGSGTAMSRGNWQSAANQTLAQASCVNVAAEATIDISTRELTVNVEAYYTDNSIVASNKIHVALLQNNIEGPQSGSSANPTQVLPNGNYNHQHMLRHLLTGQWGENVSPTTTGSFFQNTYNYTIPTNLNGIAYDLFNLDIVVFISEGNQEIITGNIGSMTHIVPPGVNLIDLSATTNMTIPTSLCDNNITPEITVNNNSVLPVDTFEVSYAINQNNPITQAVYTTLASGSSTTITFPSITVPSGENTITYSSDALSGTSYIDNVPNNNLASSGTFNTISPNAFATSHNEGFEGYANQTSAPNNALLLNPLGHRVFIIDATWPGPNSGGYGNSQNSFRWQFCQMDNGEYAELVFEKLDFSNSVGNQITYSYSHAQATGFDNNKLQLHVSTDCGSTWNLVSELAGPDLATTNPVSPSGNFYPSASEWETDIIDLSSYDGNPEVMIAFKGMCAGGNNLYIDDIEINEASTTSLNEKENDIIIFPNPATNILNIDGAYSSVNIYNSFGQLVITSKVKDKIDTKSLSNGIYFIKLLIENKTIVKKITINN